MQLATRTLVQALPLLNLLHSTGYIHRDIKPDNVMMNSDNLFLIDFGRASSLDATVGLLGGRFEFTTPQVLEDCFHQIVFKPSQDW